MRQFKKGDRVKILRKTINQDLEHLKKYSSFEHWYPDFPYATIQRFETPYGADEECVVLSGNYFRKSDLELVTEEKKNVADSRSYFDDAYRYYMDSMLKPSELPKFYKADWAFADGVDTEPMAKLTKRQEENLSDDAKALVKAGVLDGELDIQSSEKAIDLLVRLNFKQLAELARADLAEEEAEKAKKETK